ncbi:MAG: VOC family protein [Acetanaerobacterium sp.]
MDKDMVSAAAKLIPFGSFSHIALVVRDMEQSVQTYCQLLGVERPPLKQTGEPDKAKVKFEGKSTPARVQQSFFTMGGLRIELMQPDEHPSTWRETLDNKGEGLHHIAFDVPSIDESAGGLEAMGMPVVQTGFYNGGKYAYVDSRAALGMMLELLETF